MNIKPIHPFPARMAPEIATAKISKLPANSIVLDPMMGSGTVLRQAVQVGHHAVGFDMDPLALLMSRVWSTSVDDDVIERGLRVLEDVLPTLKGDIDLPWIDNDAQTSEFVRFWFGEKQRQTLRKLSFVLNDPNFSSKPEHAKVADVLKIAMSRIIITKGDGASLAHDVSHSRPHRVMMSSSYDVLAGFRRSLKQVRERIKATPKGASIRTSLGDARKGNRMAAASVDMVLTSPPYLNAIDYMRGHRLSLVWLGYSISDLGSIRSSSVGAERKAAQPISEKGRVVQMAMVDASSLSSRNLAIVERFSTDLVEMMSQIARVTKYSGQAVLVVGNSCLKGTFVKNSEGVRTAAEMANLICTDETVRDLPESSRYLPTPKSTDSKLGKRMRTESILTFVHAV